MTMKLTIALTIVLMAAGCTQAPQTDLEGLQAMGDVWQSAYDSKDAAAIAAVYSEDAALLPPNVKTLTGRDEIEAMFTMFYENGLHVQITDSETYAEGDIGYKIGTFIMTTADGSILDEGKYTEIWRRLDGQWMLHRDMFNSNLPVPVPEPQAAPDGEPEGAD